MIERYVIFDIDGTLSNTTKADDRCFFKAFQETFGLDISHMDWESFEHVTDEAITREIMEREQHIAISDQEMERMKSAFMRALDDEFVKDNAQFIEVPGARSFFDLLRTLDKVEVGVATGSWRDSGLFKLKRVGIDIAGLAYSNADRYHTRQEICLDSIAQAGGAADLDKVIYFGDGAWDKKTCEAIGVRMIGIDCQDNGRLRDLGAEQVFRDYSNPQELLQLILE